MDASRSNLILIELFYLLYLFLRDGGRAGAVTCDATLHSHSTLCFVQAIAVTKASGVNMRLNSSNGSASVEQVMTCPRTHHELARTLFHSRMHSLTHALNLMIYSTHARTDAYPHARTHAHTHTINQTLTHSRSHARTPVIAQTLTHA